MAVSLTLTIFVFIISVIFPAIFILQIIGEPKECPKVPYFLHRTGAIASLGLIGYGLVNWTTYAAILLVNVNQSFLLFMLCVVALYVVDTMQTVNKLKLGRPTFIMIFVSGMLNVVLTAIGVVTRLAIDRWWPQLIGITYTLFSVNLSWIFMTYSYHRIIKVMSSIDVRYRSQFYASQMKRLKWSVLLISLTCILASAYNGNNIYGLILKLSRSDARSFDTSILVLGFLVQLGGVLVVMWFGWTPLPFGKNSPQSHTGGTPTRPGISHTPHGGQNNSQPSDPVELEIDAAHQIHTDEILSPSGTGSGSGSNWNTLESSAVGTLPVRE